LAVIRGIRRIFSVESGVAVIRSARPQRLAQGPLGFFEGYLTVYFRCQNGGSTRDCDIGDDYSAWAAASLLRLRSVERSTGEPTSSAVRAAWRNGGCRETMGKNGLWNQSR
jgi:hypothetical protein